VNIPARAIIAVQGVSHFEVKLFGYADFLLEHCLIYLDRSDPDDVHRAIPGGEEIFFQFVIGNQNGVEAPFFDTAHEGTFAIAARDPPPVVGGFHAGITANAFYSLLGDADHWEIVILRVPVCRVCRRGGFSRQQPWRNAFPFPPFARVYRPHGVRKPASVHILSWGR
jgi:hypothetical protein